MLPVVLFLSAGLFLSTENQLQGEWMLLETASETRSDRGDEAIRMSITGKAVVMKFRELLTNRGSVTLRPGIIDLQFGDGQPVRGVYSLEGDILILCFAEPGQSRPISLTPRGTQWLERWQRVRP